SRRVDASVEDPSASEFRPGGRNRSHRGEDRRRTAHVSDDATTDTRDKAVALNLDPRTYGTFAEIGGGQEVARWFFRVGGAAGTVAKTISAYDTAVSDALYGPAQRYVSRQRLESLLEHEFGQLLERLAPARGGTTAVF